MKKTISIVLVLTMAASLFGCSAFQTESKKKSKKGDFDEDEIVEVAENFAKAIKKADADGFEEISSDKKAADLFDELVVGSDYDKDEKNIFGAVLDSMEYEVDEDSVDGDEDGAEVTVTFTMADYKNIIKNGEFYDADEMVDAIEDGDETTDVEVKLELENDDDDWKVSNASKALKSVCTWSDFEYIDYITEPVIDTEPSTTETTTEATTTSSSGSFDGDYVGAMTGDYYWYDCGNKHKNDSKYDFPNAGMVELDVIIDPSAVDGDWSDDIVYEVYIDGDYVCWAYVYTLEEDGEGLVICSISAKDFPDYVDGKGYFGNHDFEFRLFDEKDNLIETYTCTTSYKDFGYNIVEEEFGDSDQVSNIYFVDWYSAEPEYLEFNIFIQDYGTDMDFDYNFYDADGNTLITDSVTGSMTFLVCYLKPSECGLEKFEGNYTVECKDKDGNLIVKSTVEVK
ncbi:MAG: hypothetical protein J6U23_09710 [Clostridiales bacterium]|nr:hypothetical protein [Clostridiales bacterium]